MPEHSQHDTDMRKKHIELSSAEAFSRYHMISEVRSELDHIWRTWPSDGVKSSCKTRYLRACASSCRVTAAFFDKLADEQEVGNAE